MSKLPTWKIPDGELDETAVGNVILLNLVGGFQEQRLVRGHFVEHHFLKINNILKIDLMAGCRNKVSLGGIL